MESEQLEQLNNLEKEIISKKRKRTRCWKRQNYLKKKAEREARKRKRRKKWLKSGRKKVTGRLNPKNPDKFTQIKSPLNFSFIKNTDEVLKYFKKCKKTLDKREQIEFDLSDIDNLSPDAIALLIAKVKDENFRRGLNVRGKNPREEKLKKMFISSGFMDHVRSGFVADKNDNNFLIHKITDKKVENNVAKQACELAVKHTFGSEIKFRPIFVILIECMANTNNHAGLDKQGTYDWWILLYSDPKTKITSFSFLDLGAGIFNSISVKNYWDKILTSVRYKNNIDLIPKLFSGEIFLTRTKEKNRGKGFPLIYNHSNNNCIKNFMIISNDVRVKIPSKECQKLKHKFQGTFLYWELHPNK